MFSNDSCNVIVPPQEYFTIIYTVWATVFFDTIYNAESLGLGAVWLAIAPIEERMKKAKKVLGIGKNLIPFVLVPLGYPQYEQKQKSRFDGSRIHWVK